MNIKKIVSIDIEGNGASPAEIIEISVIKVRENKIIKDKTWLIKPEKPVSKYVTDIHGIRNEDLIGKPFFSEIKDEILDYVRNSVLLSHNVSVEKNILNRYLPEWEPLGFIDTLTASKKILPNTKSFSLTNLVKELEIENLFINKVSMMHMPHFIFTLNY